VGSRSPVIVIRPLAPEHIDAVVHLWKQADLPYRPTGRDEPGALGTQMAANRDLFLGAFAEPDGRLAGIVIGSIDGRQKGWVNRLAVDPAFRRHGIARLLLAEIETRLKARGALLVAALIEVENDASLTLFRATGYEETRGLVYLRKSFVPGA
jgi:ribosomal protein S18 acetylase RimI-like enzyme